MQELPPASDSKSTSTKFWATVNASSNLVTLFGGLSSVAGLALSFLTNVPILGPVLIAFGLGAFFVLMVARLSLASEESDVITIGAWRQGYQLPASPSQTPALLTNLQFVRTETPHARLDVDIPRHIRSPMETGTLIAVAVFGNEPDEVARR